MANQKLQYRADLDGIRSLAVISVILFHYGISIFSGGYVGVDIFFVLSGYLISSIIFNQLDSDTFCFKNFYFRRFRRLFPVYIVVMLVTLALAFKFMLPQDFREFGQSLLASTLYVSNILFFLEAGYFDSASHLKPLLHTWSLSVEEQFYIFFPVLAWLISKVNKKAWLPIFLILTLASFSAAVYMISQDNNAVFFLYPYRAWEMFLGTLLALGVVPQLKKTYLVNGISILALAGMVFSIIYYGEQTLFPGMSALLPCLATVLLVYAGMSESGWVQKLFSTQILVFLGKLSYSLYLWHWPIYVLFVYNIAGELVWTHIVMMMVLTFVASYLSWRYIEAPFREGKVIFSKSIKGVFGAVFISSLIMICIGFYIHKTNGMPQRLDAKTAEFALAAGDLFGDLNGCLEEGNDVHPDIGFCEINKPFEAESYTLIWGDSHGGAYKRGYTDAVADLNSSAFLAWTGGCPPLLGISKDETASSKIIDDKCPPRNRAVLDLIKNDKRINAVVLVGRWSYYLNGNGVGVDAHNKINIWPEGRQKPMRFNHEELLVSAFHKTIAEIKAQGLRVFVVEQPPEFSRFIARPLAINLLNGSADFEKSIAEMTVEPYANVMSRQGVFLDAMNKAEQDGDVRVLRTHHYFCKDTQCSLMKDGAPLYFDNNHVSSAGAVKINGMFDTLLDYLKSGKSS